MCRSISFLSFASHSVWDQEHENADDPKKWIVFKNLFKKQYKFIILARTVKHGEYGNLWISIPFLKYAWGKV